MSHSIPSNAIPNLFKGVTFFINDTISTKIRLALEDLLIEWGATKCPPPPPPSPEEEEGSKVRFDLLKLTHFITDTLDFPEYDYLSSSSSGDQQQEQEEKKKKKDKKSSELRGDDKFGDGKYKIVTPAWVTRSFDLQVLQQSRFYSPDPSLFLSGTCICTSGLPISDDLTICTATEAFGGQWRRELTREVTHLICVSPQGSKYEMALKFGTELGIAILLPHWFEESLKLGCLVPMEIFRFPNPPFTNSLRDTTTSTNSSIIKPFVERLTDYWKSHLSSLPSSNSNSSSQLPPLTTTPKTSTHVILGLEQGLSLPLNKKLKDSEKYFKSCLLQQQGQGGQQGGSTLSRELSNGSLGNRGYGNSSSRSQQQQVLNTLNSPNDFDSDDDDATENKRRRKGGGIFEGKKFYLSSDLGLSRGIEKAIVSKILNFGAESVWSFGLNNNNDNDNNGRQDGDGDDHDNDEEGEDEFEKKEMKSRRRRRFDSWEKRRLAEKKLRESDFVILRNREGWEYWLSYSLSSTSTGGISIGTPAWLFYTFSQKCLSSPLSRLIHYPPPSQKGVLEFKSKIITVSNYTGLAREYVRTLIELLGAKYEGTMSRQTDFVITCTSLGSKCLHAKNWNIPLCNHLWLESCVLSWQFLSPALSINYQVEQGGGGGTMFPTILGWRGWTKDAIDKWNLSEERKEERERASKSVDELEKEEEQARTIERMAQQEVVEEEEKDQMEIGEMMIDDEKENVQKEEEEEEEQAKTTSTTKLEKVLPVQEKKRSSTKDQELVPVVDIVNNNNNDNNNKKKKISSKSKTTNGDDDDKEQAQVRAREEVEPIRARSKSTKLVSPVRPPPPEEEEEQTPPVRSKSRTPKKKSSKPLPAPPPADVVNGEKEEAESSALSDDDSSSTSSSSSDEEKKPTPQMSKHFNQIDPHNLVPLGSRRAAAVRGQAKLHDVIEDKNKYDLEQKKKNNSAKKGTGGGGARRSSQIGTTRGESGSPSKGKKKVKSEEEIESDLEMNEGEEEEEEEKPVVQKKVRGKTKRASTEDGDDGDGDQKPMKKKQRVVNKNLKSVKAGGGGDGDSTTQEGGAISSFDNPPKAKPSSIKSKKVRIISTGLGLDKTSSEIRDLKPFGVSWTDKPQEATHLVVKNLSRTEKFLCALPYTPFIVTKKWIDACIDAKELVDETPYLLKDKKKEQELGETLETILNRARTEGKVFNGKTIYITKGVSPGLPTMQRIVQASGGTIGLNDLKKQHKLIIEDSQALVVSSPNERREWEKLASEGIPIYSCEAVFVATMHQVLEKGFNSDNRVDPQLLA
ncbi:hypothetical protein JCM3765_002184 [Sporobolomyces pararoseus]